MARRPPFARIPATAAPAPPAPIVLSRDDAAIWRAAVGARLDAQRQAELVIMRARLAVGEAAEAEIAMLRGMAEKHGFDPELAWRLEEDGRVVRVVPQEPPRRPA